MKFLEPPQQEENITALKAELRFKILPNSPGIGLGQYLSLLEGRGTL